MTDLLTRLLSAGLGLTKDDFDGHETDLYVRAKEGVSAWLEANYEWHKNVTPFRSSIPPHDLWLDIPFAG